MVLSYNVQLIATSTTVGSTVDTLFVNPTESTVNITFPAISGNGQRYFLKRCDSSESTVVIIPTGSNTIGGSSTQNIGQGQCLEFVSIDTNWELVFNITL